MSSISVERPSPLDRRISRRGFVALPVAAAGAVLLGLPPQDTRARETFGPKEAIDEATKYLEDNYGGRPVEVVSTRVLSTVISQPVSLEPVVIDAKVIQTDKQFDAFLKESIGENDQLNKKSIRELKKQLKKEGEKNSRGMGQYIAVQVWNPQEQASDQREYLKRGNVVEKDDGVLHVDLVKVKEADLKNMDPKERESVCLLERAVFLIGTENTFSVNTAVASIS